MALIPNIKKTPSKETSSKSIHQPPKDKPIRKSRRGKRGLIIALIVIALLLLALGIIGYNVRIMYVEGMAAKDNFLAAKDDYNQQHFKKGANHLTQAETNLSRAYTASQRLNWIKWLPWVSTQFQAVDNLLLGGAKGAKGMAEMSYVADDMLSKIKSDDTNLANITADQRKHILETITTSTDRLNVAQQDLEQAITALEAVPDEGVVGPLAVLIVPLKENLPLARQVVDKALPFLRVAPIIVGYPEEQTYLFLLQNNTELRATGGFIGTYGELVLKNGDIKDFKTNNIYNIDNPVKDELFITPPEPFTAYLGITQWFMRDANWSPDFPTAAEKVEEFYHMENGTANRIDGVIAVTPQFIKSLIDVTGPITVEGEEYNSQNLTDKLQYEVEVGYREDGIAESARKEVIGKMSSELMKRLLHLPKSQWGSMVKAALQNLDTKQILLYSKNVEAQQLITELDWSGAITEHPNKDFLMVVDSNLGAKKTDRVMTKNIDYQIRKENDKYIATITLKYYNDGVFDTFTTRYRSYMRIYVPYGSQLIKTTGFFTNDRLNNGTPISAKVTQDEPLKKTVFEGFISVEPKTEETITLQYQLPDTLAEQIDRGIYEAYIQKQPGTDNVHFSSTIDFGKAIESFTPVDKVQKTGNNEVHFSAILDTDKDITIHYR